MTDEQRLTRRQGAILSAATGILCGPVSDLHKLANELLGRPVYTHEFADKKTMEELTAAAKPLLQAIVADEAHERTEHLDWYTTAEARQAMREAVQSVYPHVAGDILDHALACAWVAYLNGDTHES